MQTLGLNVHHSWEVAAVLAAGGGVAALSDNRAVRVVGAFARETAVIGFLYGLWQVAGSLSVTSKAGAYERAHWIQRFERQLPLPSERSVQDVILGHGAVVHFFNYYYAAMHFTTMLLFLIWLFARHRDRYRPVRQVMAWTTLGCLIVQLMPVAPPRMLPGIIDTGLRYHESVYSNGLPIDQLSSMPSVHVAWAVLVGYYTWRISPSRWRYLGPAHSVLMTFVVVATGNHWWLDGIVAVAILSVCAWAVLGTRVAWHHIVRRLTGPRATTFDDLGPAVRRSIYRTTIPIGDVPAGSATGELGSSVNVPPLTAKVLTTSPRPPVTDRILPSGDRRASTAPVPFVNAVVPTSDNDPSARIA